MTNKQESPKSWLTISLILIMLGSVFAYLFNTSFGSVQVSRVEFETERGRLSGLLYMPKGAGPADPRPAIVTTHGYLNAKEMQAAPAIEMSRRGVIVLALDSYGHGDSFLNSYPKGMEFMSYWPYSLYDAAKYLYGRPYVLKDESGNGAIAVSGHSMGGFSSTMAVVFDENEFLRLTEEGEPAYRMIAAGLSVGADYRFTKFLGIDPATADAMYADRTMGMIAGRYDEFFFDAEAEATGRTMIRKDFVGTEEGRTFLGNPDDPKAGEFHQTSAGGRRIVYQPAQTHPWNHISMKTTGHMIDFYEMAFADISPGFGEKNGQIWIWKELMETVGLVGFFLLFVPLVLLLTRKSFLGNAVTEPLGEFTGPESAGGKALFWSFLAFGAAYPALIYTTYLNKSASGLATVKIIALVVFFASLLAAILRAVKGNTKGSLGFIAVAGGSFVLAGLAAGSEDLFTLGPVYNSPVTNNVAYWAVSVSAIILTMTALVHQFAKESSIPSLRQYGFLVSGKSILASFCVAVLAAAAGFIILQIVNGLFNTDFRLWLVVVRKFNVRHLLTAIRYMPFFFAYFLMNGIAVQANTNSRYAQGAKGYLMALLMNIGGLVVWLVLQYGILFITGKAPFVAQALNSIVLIGLTVNLGIATIITKKCLEKTNNVFTGAFLNTILITVITISSSTMYWSIGG